MPKDQDARSNDTVASLSDQAQAKFEVGIALALHSWQALTVAVQNQWGGPDSADKRDWLAGAIAEQFQNDTETDGDDVADILLQVMEDEFEVVVDDGSEVPIATKVMKIRTEVKDGDFRTVDDMLAKWQERKDKPAPQVKVQSQSDSEESVDDEDWEDDRDIEMADAPTLIPSAPKPKHPPEVDEDGFTKVVGKKRR